MWRSCYIIRPGKKNYHAEVNTLCWVGQMAHREPVLTDIIRHPKQVRPFLLSRCISPHLHSNRFCTSSGSAAKSFIYWPPPTTLTCCRLFKFCRSESLFLLFRNSIFHFIASLLSLLSFYFILFHLHLRVRSLTQTFLTWLHTHNYPSVKVIVPDNVFPPTWLRLRLKTFRIFSLYHHRIAESHRSIGVKSEINVLSHYYR